MVSVTLCLRLVKDETSYTSGESTKFANRTYMRFVDGFLKSSNLDEATVEDFCAKYLDRYYDLQFYFLQNAGYFCDRRVLTT
jgi:hypothetical protein